MLFDIIYKLSENPEKSQDFFLKYLPALSPLIVILTFVFNNRYDRNNKRKEARRSWYFKAYFEPNLKKIEAFFDQADQILENGKNTFNKNFKSGKNSLNNKVIAATLAELSRLKRKFTYEVLEIIKPAYPDEFELMNNHLLDFEDAGSDVFDDTSKLVSDQQYFSYIATLSTIKANLINVLSGPAL